MDANPLRWYVPLVSFKIFRKIQTAAGCRCELEPLAVDAGVVYYGREREVHLILSNKGVAQAAWQFMSLPGVMFGDSKDPAIRPAPRWAQVMPQQVYIQCLTESFRQFFIHLSSLLIKVQMPFEWCLHRLRSLTS